MEHLAAVAFRELKLAGFEVKYFDHVGIIEIIICEEKYYICQFPEIAEYGAAFKTYEKDEHITLYYEDGKKCVIQLARQNICIHGEMYEQMEYNNDCIGYLYNNLYVEYGGLWIKMRNYSFIGGMIWSGVVTNFDIFTKDNGDILDSEFMPVKPRPVDIKNEGFKIVQFNYIDESKINAFTTMDLINQIIDGKFLESGSGDLFKYVDEDGALFALLFNAQTKETTLAGATKIIKVADTKPHAVKCVDGLYNGYEIKNDLTELRCEYNDYGDYIDYDGNLTDYPSPSIYCYNHIFCAVDASEAVIELDARKPDSGARTKAAPVDL